MADLIGRAEQNWMSTIYQISNEFNSLDPPFPRSKIMLYLEDLAKTYKQILRQV